MSAQISWNLRSEDANEQLKSWLHDYVCLPGVTDELIDAEGCPRSHWISLLETLSSLGEEGLSQHFSVAGRRIKEMGVTYRVRGEERERQWPLSHLPLLLTETEWREIAAGIEQRAELLNLILDDAYGRGRLVSDGVLPAAVVAGSPEYLRSMCGVQPKDKRWISFYAADIARGPDGKWWVLGDRTQAPSGVGYALENRLILARTFPSLYRDMNVRRLASFFREFRNNL
ncbi:MAG: circularly permuted type 2 ATP-grasp protein, partial [Methylocystis sp.]